MMERTPPASAQASVPLEPICIAPSGCQLCKALMQEGDNCLIINDCSHPFHRKCIEDWLTTSSVCPICQHSCQLSELRKLIIEPKKSAPSRSQRGRGAVPKNYKTRSSGLTLDNSLDFLSLSTPPRATSGVAQEQAAANLNPTAESQHPDASTVAIDYAEINRMIELNLTRILQNMNLAPINARNDLSSGNGNEPMGNLSGLGGGPFVGTDRQPLPQNRNPSAISPHSCSGSNLSGIPFDKITSLIQNWNLRFDGSPAGLNVEEFLYRVRSLTRDNLNGDFSVICKNLNILLIGKAREWFWRYHKNVQVVEWNHFCGAIRNQYKEFKSTFDIKEEIRCRKQKTNETYDTFFDSITTIMDRLPEPIAEGELIEILLRNLRPDIRQELLYIQITSLSHLRRLVQMRENFLNDEHVRKSLAYRPNILPTQRRNISELEVMDQEVPYVDDTSDNFVEAVHRTDSTFTCWNCGEAGHHWQDCLKDRTVFCYGCGLKDTYKPNCLRCASRKNSGSKNFMTSGPKKDLN